MSTIPALRMPSFVVPAVHGLAVQPAFKLQASLKCRIAGCRAFLKIDADRVAGPDRSPRLCDGCITDLELDLADLVVASDTLPVVAKPTELTDDEVPTGAPLTLDAEDEADAQAEAEARRRPIFEPAPPVLEDVESEPAVLRCAFCVDAAVDACDHEGCGKPLCGGCASDDHHCPEHA